MKATRVFRPRSVRFWVAAAMALVVLLAVGRDRAPTQAANPEILPSLSASSPSWSSAAILLVKGGHQALNQPCVPGDSDPTTICVRVWAKDVNNSTGVSAFQLHYTYPDNMLIVSAAGPSSTWISSTGRSAACPSGSYTSGEGTFECTTLSAPPPFGPTGSGILGTLAIESRNANGPAVVNLCPDPNCDYTFLVDTPPNIDNAAKIPATVRSLNLFVAPCANFVGGDSKVTGSDIVYVVQHYHTTDPAADLNADGLVTANDIVITVGEYNFTCTR